MSATVLYMSMSLDGFIAGPNEGPGNGLGDGGERLHDWSMTGGGVDLEAFRRLGGVNQEGVPFSIPPRHDPDDMRQWPLVTYVNDVTSAMTQAKEAAGDKNVLVHGAGTAQLALAAGVLDEIELHVIPVLFGQGRRLFEGLAPEQIELQRTRIVEGESGVTHMHYRVR